MTGCFHVAPASCELCDGTAHDELDALLDEHGPTGEACIGIDWDGQLCPRRAEDGSLFCEVTHSVLGADRLADAPVLEVAA